MTRTVMNALTRQKLARRFNVFQMLYEKYLNNLTLALGAYNVGPAKVKIRGPLISRGKRYAEKVMNRSQYYRENAAQMEIDLKRLESILNE